MSRLPGSRHSLTAYRRLFLALKCCGNFAQFLVLLRPARFCAPGQNLLKRVALIYGRMKKHKIRSLLLTTHFIL